MQMTIKNHNSIILFDASCNIKDLTKNKIQNSLIITFDYDSHKKLEKSGISHLISDSYLDQYFLSSHRKISYNLSKWYTQKSVEKAVEYEGLNLGEFFYLELSNILTPFLKRFFEISKIFEANSQSSFFASQNLYNIINSFSTNVKMLRSVKTIKSEFDYPYFDIPFKFGPKRAHIRISKSKFRKVLNLSEKFQNLKLQKQSIF